MAENFVTGMQQGVQAANEMIYGRQKASAETSLLSSRAEQAKIQVDTMKEEQTRKLAEQASLTRASQSGLVTAIDDNERALQKYSLAMKTTDDPALQESFRTKMNSIQTEMDNQKITHEKARLGQKQAEYDKVREHVGMNDTQGLRDLAKTSGDKNYSKLADVLEGTTPIPGTTISYLKATDQQKQDFIAQVGRAMGPAKDPTAHQIETAKVASEKAAALVAAAELKAVVDSQRIAEQRDRQETKARDKSSQMAQETRDYEYKRNRLEDQLTKIQEEAPTITKIVPGKFWDSSEEIINPAIATKQKQIEALDESHQATMNRFEGVDQIQEEDKATGSDGVTHSRPAGWDDTKWKAYKKAIGAK